MGTWRYASIRGRSSRCRHLPKAWQASRTPERSGPPAFLTSLTASGSSMPVRPRAERLVTCSKSPIWTWSRSTATRNDWGGIPRTWTGWACDAGRLRRRRPARNLVGRASVSEDPARRSLQRLAGWRAGIPTFAGIAGPPTLPGLRPSRPSFSMECGKSLRLVVNCSTRPARSSGKKTNPRWTLFSPGTPRHAWHVSSRTPPRAAGSSPRRSRWFLLCPTRKALGRAWLLALGAFVLALLVVAAPAKAEGISPVVAKVEAGEDGYRLDAEFDIQFSPRLEEAVNRGVALYFVVEFELSQPRWYWFNEKPVQRSARPTRSPTRRCLRQYRLSVGAAYQNFTTIRRGRAARCRACAAGRSPTRAPCARRTSYQAAMRMRLDTAQLPKPFQLNAVASRDWNLASDWYRWTVNP